MLRAGMVVFVLGTGLPALFPVVPPVCVFLLSSRTGLPLSWGLMISLLLYGVWQLRPRVCHNKTGSHKKSHQKKHHQKESHQKKWQAVVMLCCLLLGMQWHLSTAWSRLQARLPAAQEDRLVAIEGYISDLPETRAAVTGIRSRFLLQVTAHGSPPGRLTGHRIQLGWVHAPLLLPGQHWQLTVRLHNIHGFANPGGFDSEAWHMLNDTVAVGSVHAGVLMAPGSMRNADDQWHASLQWRLSEFVSGIDRLRLQLRHALLHMQAPSDAVNAVLPDKREGGSAQRAVLLALISGDRAAIAQQQWDDYARTGIVHLMAISGTHVVMFGAVLGWLVQRLRRRWHSGRGLSAMQAGVLAMWLGSAMYSLFAGASVPTLRTLLALLLLCIALLRERQLYWPDLFLFAVLALCLGNPLIVLSGAFWLSFTAASALWLGFAGEQKPVYTTVSGAVTTERDSITGDSGDSNAASDRSSVTMPWLRHSAMRIGQGLCVLFCAQLLVTIAMLPLDAWLFGRLALNGWWLNLLAIPLLGLLIVPLGLLGAVLTLLGLPVLAEWLWQPALYLLYLLDQLVAGALSAPWPDIWPLATPSPAMLLLAILGALLFVLAWRRLPVLACCGLLLQWPLLANPGWAAPAPGAVRVIVMDVGQGLSLLVQSHEQTLLFDTGPRLGRSDAGNLVIVPLLRALGIKQLDTVVLSHDDNDHTGGVDGLRHHQVPVQRWLAGQAISVQAGSGQTYTGQQSMLSCHGQQWLSSGVNFRFLSASGLATGSDNNASCVLRVTAGQHSLLIPADLESEGEQALLQAAQHSGNRTMLQADWLVVGHHGSRTSTTEAFLKAVHPQHAILSYGHNNRFHHPHYSIVQRLHDAQVTCHATARDGALMVEWGPGTAPHWRSWRAVQGAYWQHQAAQPGC